MVEPSLRSARDLGPIWEAMSTRGKAKAEARSSIAALNSFLDWILILEGSVCRMEPGAGESNKLRRAGSEYLVESPWQRRRSPGCLKDYRYLIDLGCGDAPSAQYTAVYQALVRTVRTVGHIVPSSCSYSNA